MLTLNVLCSLSHSVSCLLFLLFCSAPAFWLVLIVFVCLHLEMCWLILYNYCPLWSSQHLCYWRWRWYWVVNRKGICLVVLKVLQLWWLMVMYTDLQVYMSERFRNAGLIQKLWVVVTCIIYIFIDMHFMITVAPKCSDTSIIVKFFHCWLLLHQW